MNASWSKLRNASRISDNWSLFPLFFPHRSLPLVTPKVISDMELNEMNDYYYHLVKLNLNFIQLKCKRILGLSRNWLKTIAITLTFGGLKAFLLVYTGMYRVPSNLSDETLPVYSTDRNKRKKKCYMTIANAL